MWAICAVITFLCCTLVQFTFEMNWLTLHLAVAMGITSGIFCARDERKQREGHGES